MKAVKDIGAGPEAVAKPQSKTDEQRLRTNCVTKLRRVSTGMFAKSSNEDILNAKDALECYYALPDKDKTSFAQAFKQNSKTWGWVKQFAEKRTSNKSVTEKVNENYRTRT